MTAEFARAAVLAVRDFLAARLGVTVANRIVRLLLLAAGLALPEVARLTGAPRSSLLGLLSGLEALGPGGEAASLLEDGRARSGRRSPLAGEAGERLLAEMRSRSFFDLAQVRDWLRDSMGVDACLETISGFLRDHGYRKLKMGSIPAKADPARQAAFWRDELAPLLARAAEEGSRDTVLFTDASHFVIGCDFLASVWCAARRFGRTFSGRQRHNVLGGLDWATKEVVAVANDSSVDSATFVEFLEKVADRYEGRDVTLVLDNARYQKCKAVLKRAGELGIRLLYLPPYSPNLNFIERVWRMVKSDLRKSHWDDFEGFRARIDELVASTSGANRARVESLVSENVQLFDEYLPLYEGVCEAPSRRKADREAAAAARAEAADPQEGAAA